MQTTGVMQRDFFDPPEDELQLIVVGGATVVAALRLVLSCEHCQPDEAQIPFDWMLDKVTGMSGATTDYILTEPARCPTCKHEITEKTLAELIATGQRSFPDASSVPGRRRARRFPFQELLRLHPVTVATRRRSVEGSTCSPQRVTGWMCADGHGSLDLDDFFEHRNDGVSDEFAGAGDEWNYSDPAHTFGHSIIEHWLQFKLGLDVHFRANERFASFNLDAGDYCARFENPIQGLEVQYGSKIVNDIVERTLSGDACSGDHAVLVPVIDFLKLSQQKHFWPLECMVWLQFLNDCPYGVCDIGHAPFSAAVERFGTVDQWKLNIRLFSGLWFREVKGDMVETGSQLINGLSCDHAKIDGNFGDGGNDEFILPLTAVLKVNSTEIRVQERLGKSINRVAVLCRPANLPSNWIEYMGHAQ
jgi:hypothetical protein